MRKIFHRAKKDGGFTLIELLVVVAIIAILATLAIIAFTNARAKAKEGKTRADLKAIYDAVNLMVDDTGKWPDGCPADTAGAAASNESVVSINLLTDTQAGLASAPVVGDQGNGCAWTAADVSRWNGPYFSNLTDPYKNAYFFEPGHVTNGNCTTGVTGSPNGAVLSFGPDGVHGAGGGGNKDCDDIFYDIQ